MLAARAQPAPSSRALWVLWPPRSDSCHASGSAGRRVLMALIAPHVPAAGEPVHAHAGMQLAWQRGYFTFGLTLAKGFTLSTEILIGLSSTLAKTEIL